jgi:hypothetical protein
MTTMKLKSVDLFSGIGGMTKALQDICDPVIVCDVDPLCQQLLAKVVGRERVHDDVKSLSLIDCKRDLLIASSPCQGFSPVGAQRGLHDERSSLFNEIFRLIDEGHPKAVFMENVPGILPLAMESIIEELVEKRLYELRWICTPASHVGAPHLRYCWFCLAVMPGLSWSWSNLSYEKFDWNRPPRRHIHPDTPATHPTNSQRMRLLGNSLVPDCARWAFFYLVNGCVPIDIASENLSFRALQPRCKVARGGGKFPKAGYIRSRGMFELSAVKFESPSLDLELLSSRNPSVEGIKVT